MNKPESIEQHIRQAAEDVYYGLPIEADPYIDSEYGISFIAQAIRSRSNKE